MNVEIINVGTELLLGEIVNTNATVLQKMCRELGFNVYYQTVVGDNPQRLSDCLKLAFERGADCVITTGGLGPTTDDLTKELSAQYLGLDMIYNEEEAHKVKMKCQYCTGLKEIPQNNFKQAYYPQDAYILENDMGTANGCVMHKGERMIVNLPGPPKELNYVIENSLIPYLSRYKEMKIYTFEYLTMFIGESQIAEILKDIIDEQSHVSIALYAGEETVRIRLGAKAINTNDANIMMQPIKQIVEQRLANYIISEKNIKEACLKIMVPLAIEYEDDFILKDEFLRPFFSEHPKLKIRVHVQQVDLGEIVCFEFNNDFHFEVPTFVKAAYSYSRIEARFVAQLYKYVLSKFYGKGV